MKHAHEVALAKAVASLRSANSQSWDTFMAALAGRLEELTEAMVSSPPEHLTRFHGRALEARELFRELAAAPALAEQIYQQERKNGHQRKP